MTEDDYIPVSLVSGRIYLSTIIKIVATKYDISISELKSSGKRRSCTMARHEICWLARELTKLSFPRIGEIMGGFDHTAIMYGFAKIDQKYKADARFRDYMDGLKAEIMDGALAHSQVTDMEIKREYFALKYPELYKTALERLVNEMEAHDADPQ